MSWTRGNRRRVRVFVDYSNFKENRRNATKRLPHENLVWSDFPSTILEHLSRLEHVPADLEMRAIKIYASVRPVNTASRRREDRDEILFKTWLQEDLDQLPAYTVDVSARVNNPVVCDRCGGAVDHYVEQGVDTKIAIDLLALATRDLYDIAVLVTDDSDLVPSTRVVQGALDKHIVHLGFAPKQKNIRKEHKKEDLRAAAWGHLLLDDMLPDLLRTST